MHKQIEIFTDGSCFGNPGPGGCAAILRYKQHIKEFSAGFHLTTNNRMELMAIILALQLLKNPCQIILYTDSQYLLNGITQWIHIWKQHSWKAAEEKLIKNIDLWRRLDEILQLHSIKYWSWLKSHSGNANNERCDQLARIAAKHPFNKDYIHSKIVFYNHFSHFVC